MTNKLCVVSLTALLALSIYLVWENNTTRIRLEELYESHIDLREEYHNTLFDQSLLMPLGLDQHYERIRRYEQGRFVSEGDSGWLLFYCTEVLHDLGNFNYSQRYEEFENEVGIVCTNLTNDFALDFLNYVNMSSAWISWSTTNMSEVEKIYKWTDYFIDYVNDTDGFGRFPIETLTHRYGDCEDQAMALSFLLESCGYTTALCLIHDKNLTEYGSEGLYHVFCVVRKDNLEYNGTLIGLHRYPEHRNSWIVLDPAFGHQFGEDVRWIDDYRMDNETIYIPQAVWDSLLVEYSVVVDRAQELGVTLNN